MKLALCLLLFAELLLGSLCAEDQVPLQIKNPWIRAVPAVSTATAAYMTLINTGQTPLKLTGGSTPAAQMVRPMITTRKMVNGKEVYGMDFVNELEIPAGGQRTLAPHGDHLMIMGMTEPPKSGTKVKLTLHFEPGGREVTLEVPVMGEPPKRDE